MNRKQIHRLVALHNLIYYSRHYIELLPLVQKVALVACLIWVLAVSNNVVLKTKRSQIPS